MNTQTRTARRHRNFLPHLKAHTPFSSPEDADWSVLVPAQMPSERLWRGEHTLILAMIADALRSATTRINHSCQVSYCSHVDGRVRAREWLASESERPYGFRWACQHLSVNPEGVRRQLRRMDMAESGLPLFAYAISG